MTYKDIHEILKKAFVIYVPLSLLTPLLMYQWRDNNRLILMDRANSYHITEYTSDQQLRQLYEYQIKQAVFAFLMRNPNGFARVSGQLIRYYVTPHNEQRTFTLEFELNLELQVNYDTANGSRYPFIITNMKYSQLEYQESQK